MPSLSPKPPCTPVKKGFMKDMPALLLAVLAQKDVNMLARVFDQVADNGKMLRNFAQIIRSGAVGRNPSATVRKN